MEYEHVILQVAKGYIANDYEDGSLVRVNAAIIDRVRNRLSRRYKRRHIEKDLRNAILTILSGHEWVYPIKREPTDKYEEGVGNFHEAY